MPACRPQQHRQPSIKDKGAVAKFIFGTAPCFHVKNDINVSST
ncbi:hypothetical protein HMPREF1989_01861 [Porphyromonas gingivalis F0566]|nr:hypothetical protein HMPREF1989_01861 [Porphyromonas gingivalis F0566]